MRRSSSTSRARPRRGPSPSPAGRGPPSPRASSPPIRPEVAHIGRTDPPPRRTRRRRAGQSRATRSGRARAAGAATVDAPQRGRLIDARSMSRSSAARHGDDAAPVPVQRRGRAGSAGRAGRVSPQVRRPRRAPDRRQQGRHVAEVAEDREGDDLAARAARHANAPGTASTRRQERDLLRRLVAPAIASIAGRSSGRAARRRSAGSTTGKNASRTSGSSTSVDHVRQRGPARGPGGGFDLAADLVPGVAAVGAVADRIGRAQQRSDGLADRVVDDEALAPELDEGQRREPGEGVLRRGWGSTAPSSESVMRRRTEVASRASASRVEAVEVERGELLHDRRQDGVRGRVGALVHRRGCELQRQRVAVDEAVDPCGLLLVEARAAQHLGGVAGRSGPTGTARRSSPNRSATRRRAHRASPRRRARGPGSDGSSSWRSHASMSRRRRRCRSSARRARQRASAAAPSAARRGCAPGRRGSPQAWARSRGRRRRPASRRARRPRPQRPHEGRLPRAGDAVHDGHERPVVGQQRAQARELALAADDAAAALGQERAEAAAMPQALTAGSGSRAATIVAVTGLIASVGRPSASPWRRRTSGLAGLVDAVGAEGPVGLADDV